MEMPEDFAISIAAKPGTDLLLAPDQGERRQPMPGFEDTYVDIVDYIVRITINAIGPGAVQTGLRANTVKILGADAPVIHVERGSLCGGGEGDGGNLRQRKGHGLHQCRALRVTHRPAVSSLRLSAVRRDVAGSQTSAMPLPRRGSGRRFGARGRPFAPYRRQTKHHHQHPPQPCTTHESPR